MFKARGSAFCGHAEMSGIKPTTAYCVNLANGRRNAPSTILANDSATAVSLPGPSRRRLVWRQDAYNRLLT
jgi:hypothetical protein